MFTINSYSGYKPPRIAYAETFEIAEISANGVARTTGLPATITDDATGQKWSKWFGSPVREEVAAYR